MYIDIKQEVSGLEEPRVSDSEVIRDSNDEVMRLRNVMRPVGSRFLARPVVQQKDGANKARKPREASDIKEAKEKRSGTDSAARTKSRKTS